MEGSSSTSNYRHSSSSQAILTHNNPAAFILVDWLCRLIMFRHPHPTVQSRPETRRSKTPPPPPPSSSKPLDMLRVFNYFDENGDGKISPSELLRCMHLLGQEMSINDAVTAVGCTDSDGDGMLDFNDFLRLVEAEDEAERGRNLKEAFKVYEMEGQDCITPNSLRRTLGRLGEDRTVEECGDMIRRFDLNGDGVLSFDEFETMMLASSSSSSR